MFNSWLFGWLLFWSWVSSQAQSEVLDNIIFEWYWLQNSNIITSETNFWNLPKIDLLTYRTPKSDWWWVIDRFYAERDIKLSWVIYWSDTEDLEDRIDAFKNVFSKKTWYLDFKVNWVYRRTKVSLINSDIIDRRHYDITRAKFDLTFKAMEVFRYEKDHVYKAFFGTTTNINEDITNTGSIYSDPVINILVNSATTVTQIKAKIWTKQITINQTISAWDIIEIDWINKQVTINWTPVDYLGSFPVIDSWVNLFDFQSNWTFDYDIVVLYRKNYL